MRIQLFAVPVLLLAAAFTLPAEESVVEQIRANEAYQRILKKPSRMERISIRDSMEYHHLRELIKRSGEEKLADVIGPLLPLIDTSYEEFGYHSMVLLMGDNWSVSTLEMPVEPLECLAQGALIKIGEPAVVPLLQSILECSTKSGALTSLDAAVALKGKRAVRQYFLEKANDAILESEREAFRAAADHVIDAYEGGAKYAKERCYPEMSHEKADEVFVQEIKSRPTRLSQPSQQERNEKTALPIMQDLIHGLRIRSYVTRHATFDALCRNAFGHGEIVLDAMVDALNSDDSELQIKAIDYLAQFPAAEPRVIAHLARISQSLDLDYEVNEKAREVLLQFGVTVLSTDVPFNEIFAAEQAKIWEKIEAEVKRHREQHEKERKSHP